MPDLMSRVLDAKRLEALQSYEILDSYPESAFDDIVMLARQICRTPIALVSLVAGDRQWFKAVSGLETCETPLEQSVCAHAIHHGETLIIPDLRDDQRTRNNPSVTGENAIRFYAGALIRTASDVLLGTVCVIDTEPRPAGLAPEQQEALEALARQVMDQLDLRKALIDGARINDELKVSEARLRLAQEAGKIGSFEVDMTTDQLIVTEQFCRLYGVAFRPTMPARDIETLVVPDDERLISTAARRQRGDIPTDTEYRIRKADSGEVVWISRRAQFLRDADGRPVRMLGTVHDVTDLKQAETQQKLLHEELGHRLKNTLALVQAMASQTLRNVSDRVAVEAFEQRITALSRAHDVLLKQSWSAADMNEVVSGVLDIHGFGSQLLIHGPTMTIGPRAALSLSLLLHELATNAVKYGALSVPQGEIDIGWNRDGETFVLTWAERNGPEVTEPTTRGLGTRLIEMGLSGTGQVVKRYDRFGASFEIRAPLSAIENAG